MSSVSTENPRLDVSSLSRTDHLPWAMPKRSWSVRQDWSDLAFLHWTVDPATLESLLPKGLALQTFADSAWLGVVPFRMAGVRFRWTPSLGRLSNFPELNLRTYVTAEGRDGVFFFALDTPSILAVLLGRGFYHLPYRRARAQIGLRQGRLHVDSRTLLPPRAEFAGTVSASGPEFYAEKGSLEHFLTERYCFYTNDGAGTLLRCNVQHDPWPLQPAQANLRFNSLLDERGVEDPLRPARCHLSRGVRVIAWSTERVTVRSDGPV